MPTSPAAHSRKLVFLGVGIANTLFDFTVYSILTQTVFNNQDQIIMAGLVSGTIAMVFAYIMHALITWRGAGITLLTLAKFTIATGIGMWLLRPLLLSLFIKLNGLYELAYSLSQIVNLPFSYNFIANTGAFGLMTAILLVYNFTAYNRFVFKSPIQTKAT